MAVIKAELEGALRAGGHDPQVREALVAAVEECDHLAQLAEDLLVVARTGEGELPVRPERLDVRELLERVAAALRRPRRASAAATIRSTPATGRRVYADELRAAPGARQPGRQRAALRRGRDRAARAPRRATGWRSRSSDEGEGFAARASPSARSSASRAATRARTRERHRPRASSIVRAIAEAHGGRAELVPGAGATVRIWLPNGAR